MVDESVNNEINNNPVTRVLWGLGNRENPDEAAKKLKDKTGDNGYVQFIKRQIINLGNRFFSKKKIYLELTIPKAKLNSIISNTAGWIDLLSDNTQFKESLDAFCVPKRVKIIIPKSKQSKIVYNGIKITDEPCFISKNDSKRYTDDDFDGNASPIGLGYKKWALAGVPGGYVIAKQALTINQWYFASDDVNPIYSKEMELSAVKLKERNDYTEIDIELSEYSSEQWTFLHGDTFDDVRLQVEMELDLKLVWSIEKSFGNADYPMVINREIFTINFIRPYDKTLMLFINAIDKITLNNNQFQNIKTVYGRVNELLKKFNSIVEIKENAKMYKDIISYYDSLKPFANSIVNFITGKINVKTSTNIKNELKTIKKQYEKIQSERYDVVWNSLLNIFIEKEISRESFNFCQAKGRLEFSFVEESEKIGDMALGLAAMVSTIKDYNNDVFIPVNESIIANKLKHSLEISEEIENQNLINKKK